MPKTHCNAVTRVIMCVFPFNYLPGKNCFRILRGDSCFAEVRSDIFLHGDFALVFFPKTLWVKGSSLGLQGGKGDFSISR